MQRTVKSPIAVLILAFVFVALFYSGYIPYERYVVKQIEAFNQISEKENQAFGYIQPQVVDGFSEKPIEGAVIVIPEMGEKYTTDAKGLTANIKVPIMEDLHFSEIHPKPWGEITLIVYKEGYVESVIFHLNVWENQTRKGPRILLFQGTAGEENRPMSVVEGPHRLWVNQLVKKYRP